MRETQILRGLGKARAKQAVARQGVQHFAGGTAFVKPVQTEEEFNRIRGLQPARVAPPAQTPLPSQASNAAHRSVWGGWTQPTTSFNPNNFTGRGAATNSQPFDPRGIASALTSPGGAGRGVVNPDIAGTQPVAPGPAPIVTTPSPPANGGDMHDPSLGTGMRNNSYSDAPGLYNGQNNVMNPGTGVHGTMTMSQWSSGGSTGQPNEQNMAAMNALAAKNDPTSPDYKAAHPTPQINPLGDPNRGLKAADYGNGLGVPQTQSQQDQQQPMQVPAALSHGTPSLQGPGTGTSDSIPAMLSKGEAVLPAKTVQKVGAGNIARLIAETNHGGKPMQRGLRAGGHYGGGLIVRPDHIMGNNELPMASDSRALVAAPEPAAPPNFTMGNNELPMASDSRELSAPPEPRARPNFQMGAGDARPGLNVAEVPPEPYRPNFTMGQGQEILGESQGGRFAGTNGMAEEVGAKAAPKPQVDINQSWKAASNRAQGLPPSGSPAMGTTTQGPMLDNVIPETPKPAATGMRGKAAEMLNKVRSAVGGGAAPAAEASWLTPSPGVRALGGLAKTAVRVNAAFAPALAAGEMAFQSPEESAAYKDKYDNPNARAASGALDWLEKTGNAATGGLAGRLGRGVSNLIAGQPMFGTEAPTPQPGAQAGAAVDPRDPFAAANRAKLDQGELDGAAAKFTPPKLGDTRNVDDARGTMDQFTALNSSDGKPVWQTVSTPGAKQAQGLRDQQWQEQRDKDKADTQADVERQSNYFQSLHDQEDKDRLMSQLTPAQAATMLIHQQRNGMGLKAAQIQAAAHIKGIGLQGENSVRTTGMNNATQHAGDLLSYGAKNKQLQFEASQKAIDRSEQGAKSYDDFVKADPNAYDDDGKGGTVFNPQKGAALSKYLAETVPNVDVNGEKMPLQQAFVYANSHARSAAQKASNDFALREFVNSYSKGALNGKGGTAGPLQLRQGPRQIDYADLAHETHGWDYVKGKMPWMNDQGVNFSTAGGSTTVPVREIMNHPNGRSMLEALSRMKAQQ